MTLCPGIHHLVIETEVHEPLLTLNHSTSRADDDSHDHIGSISTTPSGIATPQPDPVDKRLPGIVHSYFAQVGARFSSGSRESRALPFQTL